MSQKLFVYGTLKKNHYNHKYLEGLDWCGSGRITNYAMYTNGYYPTIFKCNGFSVWGEVYKIPDEKLTEYFDKLDRLEGVNTGGYRREPTYSATFGNMWVYVRDVPNYKYLLVTDGIFRGDATTTVECIGIPKSIGDLKTPGQSLLNDTSTQNQNALVLVNQAPTTPYVSSMRRAGFKVEKVK